MDVLTYWRPVLTPVANAYKLDPYLVEAVVWIESRGCADAFRHEPQFWLRYLAKKPEYKDMHPRRVSSSYGLMQIMYPVARELGYGEEPEGLFLPRTNLHLGCQKLRQLTDWAAGFASISPADRQTAILAAYNGGTGGNTPGVSLRPDNLQYASRVQATINTLRDA